MFVIKDKCVRCGGCASICPVGAIELTDEGAKINKDLCIECGSCMGICPVEAIKLSEEKQNVEA